MSDLDTSMPPWLQRNVAPQSPWITFGEMAQLNEQRQKLPLQIQGMALQNQAMQVQTEHQGLINETLSHDLQDQKEDIPIFNEWVDQYRNNPVAMVDSPEPPVKSLKYQNMVLQAKHMAAQTTFAKVYQQQKIADTTLAAQLRVEGIDVTPAMIEGQFGRNGPVEWDSATLSKLQDQANAKKQAAAESLAYARTAWHYDPVTGEPVTHGGTLSAAQRDDALLTEYEGKLQMATDAGDVKAAQTAQHHIDFLKSKHRNPLLDAKLGALKSEKAKVFELMLYSKPGSDRYKQYQETYSNLEQEMEKAIEEAQGGNPLPSVQSPGQPAQSTNAPMKIGRFNVIPH